MKPTRLARILPIALFVLGAVAALVFMLSFPAVEGLGDRVRLPVFHGAMTWVNLGGFALLGVVALAYLITRRETLYRWLEALRWVAIAVWLLGSGLGLTAALGTWDFTGSKSSPVEVAMADPRMIAQFWIVLLGIALLILPTLLDERHHLAMGDVGFVVVAWTVLLQAVLGPGRALHPDSPVLNSDEIFIKLMFFGIVGGLALAFAGAVWTVAALRAGAGITAAVSSESKLPTA